MAPGAFNLRAGAAESVPQQKHTLSNDQRYGMAEQPLRFLNFPREIRNQVYENLLCPCADGDFDQDGDKLGHWPSIGPPHETAILLTNRQIYVEAREVMLTGNQFVRVFMRGALVGKLPAEVTVQVVVQSHCSHKVAVVRKFKGAVLSYFLEDKQYRREDNLCPCSTPCNTCDILILGRDLDAFVRGVADLLLGGSIEMATAVEHRINVHGPFNKSESPISYYLEAHQRLLQPFRDHLHGFSNVKIDGKIDKTLAANVLREIQHETMPKPDEFISLIRQLKDEGNAFFSRGKITKANNRWRSASSKMQRLRFSRLWPRVRTQLGSEFVNTLAELSFDVHYNQAQATLDKLCDFEQTALGKERDVMADDLESVKGLLDMANTATDRFESTWGFNASQGAKLCFRVAQAARLREDIEGALEMIDWALRLQPDNTAIRKEATEIRMMALWLTFPI